MKAASREERATKAVLGLLATMQCPKRIGSPLRGTATPWYDAYVYSALYQPAPLYRLGPGRLWKHSIVTAFFAQFIAERQASWDPDEAFLAGLLHDLGMVALERYVGRQPELAQIIRSCQHFDHRAEEMILGFSHAYLSGLICERWKLSLSLCEAVTSHHETTSRDDLTILSAILRVADAISPMPEQVAEKDMVQPQRHSRLKYEAMAALGLESEQVDQMVSLIPFHLRSA